MITLPQLPRGRPSSSARTAYGAELQAFCDLILKINSRVDFKVSSRGWGYLLEPHGLSKGDFDKAEDLISECRRQRLLPMNIVAEDGARTFANLEDIDDDSPEDYAASIVGSLRYQHFHYTPISFWDQQPVYLEMLVEKIDLRSLFQPICSKYRIPLANARGWSDINSRWSILQRIRRHAIDWMQAAEAGKHCVILYCGDHDPAGLNISDTLRKNLSELLTHAEWLRLVDHLTIDRFGLNADFIAKHDLTWIDNLDTGSGKSLADPRHKDHKSAYVQNYIREFGVRKVEANALVVRPDAGRELCKQAIFRYLPEDAPSQYLAALKPHQDEVRLEVLRQLQEAYGDGYEDDDGGEL
jgi:hypothetical protein